MGSDGLPMAPQPGCGKANSFAKTPTAYIEFKPKYRPKLRQSHFKRVCSDCVRTHLSNLLIGHTREGHDHGSLHSKLSPA